MEPGEARASVANTKSWGLEVASPSYVEKAALHYET